MTKILREKMVSKRTQEFMEQGGKHLMYIHHPVGKKPSIVIEKGHGIWLVDTEGKEYIDMTSSGAVCHLGHGRKEIIEAIAEQARVLPWTTCWGGIANPKTIQCAEKLVEILPKGLNHIIFTSGGAESNDVAFKTAHLYWSIKGQRKSKAISLYGGYHGLGAGSWASARRSFVTETWGPQTPGFIHIPAYHCYRCKFGLKYPECDLRCARYLAELIEAERPETIAAFIAEPALGGSGQIPPPLEYWPIVRRICNDYDVLLIDDEVHTGFAKTGRMFALQHWDVEPEIMTMAKGIANGYIPFGAVAINDNVYQVLKDHELSHGYTYSGHPIGAAAAVATMDIYVKDKVSEHAARVGKHILDRLEAEFSSLPCVGSISGLGMMIGIDIVADKMTKAPLTRELRENVQREMWDKGLLARMIEGEGDSRFMIYPPCIMTEEEADKMLDMLLPIIAAIKPS